MVYCYITADNPTNCTSITCTCIMSLEWKWSTDMRKSSATKFLLNVKHNQQGGRWRTVGQAGGGWGWRWLGLEVQPHLPAGHGPYLSWMFFQQQNPEEVLVLSATLSSAGVTYWETKMFPNSQLWLLALAVTNLQLQLAFCFLCWTSTCEFRFCPCQ